MYATETNLRLVQNQTLRFVEPSDLLNEGQCGIFKSQRGSPKKETLKGKPKVNSKNSMIENSS